MLHGHDVHILHQSEKDPEILARKLADAEILVLTRERTEITERLLSLLPNLKMISQTGKRARHLDIDACTRYGVLVAEGIGSNVAPAELTWALLMNTVRQIPQAIAGMKDGHWQTNIGSCIQGKTLGIWGYGRIGKKIADYGRAFGARVMIWGSEASRRQATMDGCISADSKTHFFKNIDILSLHLRLNEHTKGIVRLEDLSMMKPTAALINTSRAELIESGALLTGLRSGHPGYAGVDVYETEPVFDQEYPLLTMPNVVCTPHIGYVEKSSYELYFGKAFENVLAFIEGQPINIVNPEVLTLSS